MLTRRRILLTAIIVAFIFGLFGLFRVLALRRPSLTTIEHARDEDVNRSRGRDDQNPTPRTKSGVDSAEQWPPPLKDEKLVGVWVQKHALSDGIPSYQVLILESDRQWVTAEVQGKLDKPNQVNDIVRGNQWKIEPLDPGKAIVGNVLILISTPEGKSPRRQGEYIAYVDAHSLVFGPIAAGIVVSKRYRTAEEFEATALRHAIDVSNETSKTESGRAKP
jgi:hypothetical protein